MLKRTTKSLFTIMACGMLMVALSDHASASLFARFIDLDENTDLTGNRTGNQDALFLQYLPYEGPGKSDFVLQRIPITSTGDAANIITPRVDFGTGTDFTQGDGTVLNRGGFSSGSVPPWQGLFNDLGVTADMDGDQIAGIWSGKISITTGGAYTFTTRSDDGSVLFIDGVEIANNNKFQGMTNRDGTVNLAAGEHDISIGFYEGGGGAGVQASYEGPDTTGRVIIDPSVLLNDVATPGTFVSGGLEGNYFDTNNSGTNGLPFGFNVDEFLLNSTNANDNVALESLNSAVQIVVGNIDFGSGTEATAGDGTELDRGGSGGNPYGGVGVSIGTDQIAAIFEGFIFIDETGDYQFTGRSDDHGRVWIDANQDGIFDGISELVASRNAGGMANYTNGPITLNKGWYSFKALTGEGGGGAGFQVSWERLTGNTFGREIIPESVLFTQIVIPEPATVTLALFGMAGLARRRRREA